MLEPFHIPVVVCYGILVRPIKLNYKTYFSLSSVQCLMRNGADTRTDARLGRGALYPKQLSPRVHVTKVDSSVVKFLLQDKG